MRNTGLCDWKIDGLQKLIMALETPSVAQGTTNRIKENKTKRRIKEKMKAIKKKQKEKTSWCLVMLQFTSQQLNIAPDV